MKENDRLFPIGVLAKLSGVHIRSLRYYEKLGILPPAYIDTETGYRYYTYRQMRIVEALQYCVELDIPLKKFSEFVEGGQIHYAALMAYGRQVTEEKLRSIRERQRFLEDMAKGLSHARNCAQQQNMVAFFPDKYIYTIPYDGSQSGGAFQSAMVRLINDLESNGLKAGYDNGVLLHVRDGVWKSYCFVDIKRTDRNLSRLPNVLKIPAGDYRCVTAPESAIQRAGELFGTLFETGRELFITETELFLEKFSYNEPVFELRCLCVENKSIM